ncbi:MAG TPA: STAS domain-containing protein [Spirochaetota bacterium]|nr:STAS domain-containing protein [Spirochaetota bacterium]HPJ40371.1 STAS domain-containing protein [Spirochaetota bacterium]HPQ53086.1 STAS domain-containing protein [Spirochaetota bacterium]
MKITAEKADNIVIFHVKGEFDFKDVPAAEEFWQNHIQENPECAAINCRELTHVDSSAIGSLIKLNNSARDKNITLVFYNVSKSLMDLLKISRLDRYFTIMTREKFESEYLKRTQ